MNRDIDEATRHGGNILKVIVVIVLLVLSLPFLSHAAMPPCMPGIPFTAQKVADVQPRYVEGALTENAYWWCENPDGTLTTYYRMCVKGRDCNWDKVGELIALFRTTADDKKSGLAASLWASGTDYDCTDAATLARTDWVGTGCQETVAIYNANKAVWLAGAPAPAKTPASVAAVTGSQVFLYYGTDYSGVTGFDTADECFRYAKTQNITRAYTCVTRTTLSVTQGATP